MKRHQVLVMDNYCPPDESATVVARSFDSLDEAIAYCKRVVDEFLQATFKPGMSADRLWKHYTTFGKNPEVWGASNDKTIFVGWDYAKRRCEVLAARAPVRAPSARARSDAGCVICLDWAGIWGRSYCPAREAFMGECIGQRDRWNGETPISLELRRAFKNWQDLYEDSPFLRREESRPDDVLARDANWAELHEEGLRLAHRLKQELGAQRVVIYGRPNDDESSLKPWQKRLVRMDGSAVEYVHKPYWTNGGASDALLV
jgi:hypothetical protein